MTERDRSSAVLLLALAGLSGFCALGYEVLYVRHVTTLLGDMAHVHAALLSTFLLGVAAGARWAHRLHPWLFALEIVTGVSAFLLPAVTGVLAESPALASVAGRPVLSVLVTAALLGLPSLAIGFSLPLFAAYVKAVRPERLAFQGVYGAYNVGAFAGILASELLLVKALGVSGSLAALGIVNVVVGLTLLSFGRDAFPAPRIEHRSFPGRTLAALALASFASSMFQLFLLRVVYMVVGPHRENFALALAVVMLGLALGAWAVSRLGLTFRGALLLLPPVVAGTFLLHVPMVRVAHALRDGMSGGVAAVLGDALIASAYGLVPMVLFGALVPALMVRERAVAEEAGRLLWASGAANAAGYVGYVFVAHPLLPTPTFLATVAGLALLAAWLGGGGTATRRAPGGRSLAAGLVVAGVAGLVALHLTWREATLYAAGRLETLDGSETVTTFRSEGESATLLEQGGTTLITYNGHPSITVSRNGVTNGAEVISGVIPALAAPTLDRALVLGLGSGITAGAAARLFDTVDVAEINPTFVDMAAVLGADNLSISTNPAARIRVADGRAFLLGRNGEYDAIVNSIPAPTYFSASKIYTSGFYERVAEALKPDGVFSTWLATAQMSERGVELVLRTLSDHFERCELRLLRDAYYMVTCAKRDRLPGTRRLADIAGPGADSVRAILRRDMADGVSPDAWLDASLISDDALRPGPPPGVRNTDDRPALEFMLTRGARSAAGYGDPFLARPDRYGVQLVRPGDAPEDVARRFRTLRTLAPRWFDAQAAPMIRRFPALMQAWLALEGEGAPADGEGAPAGGDGGA